MQGALLVVAFAAFAAAQCLPHPVGLVEATNPPFWITKPEFATLDQLKLSVDVPDVSGRTNVVLKAGTCQFTVAPVSSSDGAYCHNLYVQAFDWLALTGSCASASKIASETTADKDVFRGVVTVTWDEALPATPEGVQFTRKGEQDLVYQVVFNRKVQATTQVTLWADPKVREALTGVNLEINTPLHTDNTATLAVGVTFSVKEKFIISLDPAHAPGIVLDDGSLWLSGPTGPVNSNIQGYILQKWEMSKRAGCCSFNGINFTAHVLIDCLEPNALVCPVHGEKVPHTVHFSATTTPFCPDVFITVSASMSLATYRSDYSTLLDSYFLNGDVYASAHVDSTQVSIIDNELLFVGVAGAAIPSHLTVPAVLPNKAYNPADWFVLFDAESIPSSPSSVGWFDHAKFDANNHRMHFKAVSPNPFFTDYNDIDTFTIYARIKVTYKGNTKRAATETQVVGIKKIVTLGNKGGVASGAEVAFPLF